MIVNELLRGILQQAVSQNASDIHLASDETAFCRVAGILQPLSAEGQPLPADTVHDIASSVLSNGGQDELNQRGSSDGAISLDSDHRFRFNVYRSNGKTSMALRLLQNRFRTLAELGLREDLYELGDLKDGLVLVAGPTGSGKSTTLATLIDHINTNRACHIITIEDPVEYIHQNKQSLISQRQVGLDTESFSCALLDAVRQDPDIILVGELRDLETIRTAVMAAETGHLVLGTVHAGDCISAVERISGVFPGPEQSMIQQLLSSTLRSVIVQHLMIRTQVDDSLDPRASRNRVLASEVMHVNSAISNLIANNNLTQIRSILETSRSAGMYTLDSSLARLWRNKLITEQSARSLARNPTMLRELARAV